MMAVFFSLFLYGFTQSFPTAQTVSWCLTFMLIKGSVKFAASHTIGTRPLPPLHFSRVFSLFPVFPLFPPRGHASAAATDPPRNIFIFTLDCISTFLCVCVCVSVMTPRLLQPCFQRSAPAHFFSFLIGHVSGPGSLTLVPPQFPVDWDVQGSEDPWVGTSEMYGAYACFWILG